MFITTSATFDIETGRLTSREGFEYDGPVALCDRAAKSTAQNVGNQATAGATEYGTNAAAIGTGLIPQLQGRATAPPGYGAALPGMLSSTAANAAANAHNARQSAGLRALRTGNAAGQGAVDVAAAQAGGQNETSAIQGILGQNAQLENQQQESALNQLSGLYGTNVNAQTNMLNAGSNAANAMTNANKAGWLQNTVGVINALKPSGSVGKFGIG